MTDAPAVNARGGGARGSEAGSFEIIFYSRLTGTNYRSSWNPSVSLVPRTSLISMSPFIILCRSHLLPN